MYGVDEIFRAVFPLTGDGLHAVLPDTRFSLSVLRLRNGDVSPMFATHPHPDVRFAPLIPGACVGGVYFKPGQCPPLRIGSQLAPVNRWPGLAKALGAYAGDEHRRDEVMEALQEFSKDVPDCDRVVSLVLEHLNKGDVESFATLSARYGLSERQLRRRFQEAVGLSPRSFAVTTQLHKSLVALVRTAEPRLAVLASETGYADQSHWGRIVKRAYARSLRAAHIALREHRTQFEGRHTSETF